MRTHRLEIRVLSRVGEVVEGASILAEPEGEGASSEAAWLPTRKLYAFRSLNPGFYKILVEHPDYRSESRRVQVHQRPTQKIFTLVGFSESYTYRGSARVPYTPREDFLGVIPSSVAEPDEGIEDSLASLLNRLNLEEVDFEIIATDENVHSPSEPSIPGARIVRRREGPLADAENEDLRVLRENPLVGAAGPLFYLRGAAFSVFTNQLVVRFRPEVNQTEALQVIENLSLGVVSPVSFIPNGYLVEADAGIGEAISRVAEDLLDSEKVEYAEPQLAEVPELDVITPADYLWPGAWDRQLVGTPDAWQHLSDGLGPNLEFGRPETIIAVVDQGIKSEAGTVEHIDFQGNVSDGNPKVYQLYHFGTLIPNNDAPYGDHGVACAGVSASAADNVNSDGVAVGVAGAAPNARLMGLIFPILDLWQLEMYIWAAGLDYPSARAGFPAPIVPGADVFTTSIGFGAGAPLSQAAKDMLDLITSRGRQGKGAMAFFSSGNANRDIATYRPFGWYDRSFSIAASSLDNTGANEIRSGFSGWGLVEFCAPTNDRYPIVHNPPQSYGTWAARFDHEGNLPTVPSKTMSLAADAAAGATTVTLNDANAVVMGSFIHLGDPGTPGAEAVQVTGAPNVSTGDVPVSVLLNSHPNGESVIAGTWRVGRLTAPASIGDTSIKLDQVTDLDAGDRLLLGADGLSLAGREEVEVTGAPDATTGEVPVSALGADHPTDTEAVIGHNHHRNNFGGTSSATPLAAAVAALVLSASPNLTWVEAREIMRNTAVKLNPNNTDPIGQWLDANGDPSNVSGLPPVFSQWYGYGRVDAAAAVQAALAYSFERDLVIRDTLADTGLTATSPGSDSPDIWVRNSDPAVDPGATPSGYGVVGPHQDPDYNQSNWIHARIKNIGSVESLDAWVRFYVASGDGLPFIYPDEWIPQNGLGNISPSEWNPGTYLIGEVAITGVPAGGEEIVNIPWPHLLLPSPTTPGGAAWDPHVLVEVTPHDGPLSGTTIDENNNLARHSVTIVDNVEPEVFFGDQAGFPLARSLAVPAGQASTDLPFRILVTDAGYFDVESVSFLVTWRMRDGTETTITYAHDGSGWAPDAPAPTALTFPNPTTGVGAPASGHQRGARWDATLTATGEVEEVVLQVDVADLSGNATAPADATHLVRIAIPTDAILLLDYSGSMLRTDSSGQSKWDSAKEATNLFDAVYAALSPPGLGQRIGLVRFFADGSSGPDQTEVTEALSPPDATTDLVDEPAPANANFWTPMGSSLVAAHGEATPAAPNWRNRIMVLLTDGLENRDPHLADIRAAPAGDPQHVPSVTEDAQLGYRIHTCAFGPPGQVDTAAIQALVLGGDGLKDYDGKLHSTETTENPDAAFALKEQFLSLLADALPVDIIGPTDGDLLIEPGVSAAVFVVTDEVSFTVTSPPAHPDPIPAVVTRPGFSFVRVDDPYPGGWSLGGFSPSPSVKAFAVVDLSLKANFHVGGDGSSHVGMPIALQADIREDGQGVLDAHVTVQVEGPGESLGDLLTTYVRSSNFDRNHWLKVRNDVAQVEPIGLRKRLFDAAIEARGKSLIWNRNRLTLNPDSTPGQFQGVWTGTLEEGTYTFRFQATGKTRVGAPFRRDYVVSRHLTAAPDPDQTDVNMISYPQKHEDIELWRVEINPRNHVGRPIGPGLAEKFLLIVEDSKAHSRQETRIANNTIDLTDNLDGTYSAKVGRALGAGPPHLKLSFAGREILIDASPSLCHRIRVRLVRIRVSDDKETWFPSPGELVFNSVVTPNGDPNRAVHRRVPQSGVIRLSDGEARDLDVMLFDGYVERGAMLSVSLSGSEYDRIILFDKEDPLERYHRRFTGPISAWEGAYSPADEPDDPEGLRDWQLWYQIEVT